MTVVYGLPGCDRCRKARAALAAAGAKVTFRDVRTSPLSAAERAEFLAAFGARLVNRASATWRALDAAERQAGDAALLLRHPALMTRPVIRAGEALYLGWTPAVQAALLT